MQNLVDLTTEIGKWMDTRKLLDGRIEQFTRNVEAHLNRILKVEDNLLLTKLYATIDTGGEFTLPATYRGSRRVRYNGGNLDQLSPHDFLDRQDNAIDCNNGPEVYTIIGGKLFVYPPLALAEEVVLVPPVNVTGRFSSAGVPNNQGILEWENSAAYSTLRVHIEHDDNGTVSTQIVDLGPTDVIYIHTFNKTDGNQNYTMWLEATGLSGEVCTSDGQIFTPYVPWTNPYSNYAEGTALEAEYVEIWNYQSLAPVTDTTGNWLLSNHPDIYLYGVLAEASGDRMDEEREKKWDKKYQTIIQDLIAADTDKKWSGGPLKVRAR